MNENVASFFERGGSERFEALPQADTREPAEPFVQFAVRRGVEEQTPVAAEEFVAGADELVRGRPFEQQHRIGQGQFGRDAKRVRIDVLEQCRAVDGEAMAMGNLPHGPRHPGHALHHAGEHRRIDEYGGRIDLAQNPAEFLELHSTALEGVRM